LRVAVKAWAKIECGSYFRASERLEHEDAEAAKTTKREEDEVHALTGSSRSSMVARFFAFFVIFVSSRSTYLRRKNTNHIRGNYTLRIAAIAREPAARADDLAVALDDRAIADPAAGVVIVLWLGTLWRPVS
jgi:hypothetical protein